MDRDLATLSRNDAPARHATAAALISVCLGFFVIQLGSLLGSGPGHGQALNLHVPLLVATAG